MFCDEATKKVNDFCSVHVGVTTRIVLETHLHYQQVHDCGRPAVQGKSCEEAEF